MAIARPGLFALDRKPVGAEIDMHALRLRRMAVPIKLVAEHGDDHDQAAKHEIKNVVAIHMSLRCS